MAIMEMTPCHSMESMKALNTSMASLYMCEKHGNWNKIVVVQRGCTKNLWDIYLGIIH